jgi:PhnB protein
MASRLNPYLAFNGTAREAMEFYKSALGGELTLSTFGEFGAPEGVDPNGVMHAQLETPSGFTVMASDTMSGQPAPDQSSISVSLSGDDADELRGYWDKLSEGGTVTMPLERQMWGDEFGMLTDRFGTSWMVNIAGERAGSGGTASG